MALKQKMESPSGVVLENGYHKVSEGTLKWIEKKRRWYLRYTVSHYFNRATRKEGKEPVFYSNYIMKVNLTDEAPHPITQAYEHLKTMEGFKEAEDL